MFVPIGGSGTRNGAPKGARDGAGLRAPRPSGAPTGARPPGLVTLRVRYVETDAMGVAHHASYFAWFEVARTEYMRGRGLPYAELERRGFRLPVIEVHSRYRRPVGYDELLTIETRPSGVKGLRLAFEYRVLDSAGNLVAEAGTVHAVVDGEGRPVNVAKRAPEVWALIEKALG